MLFNTKRIIDICAKRQITTNQLLYLYGIYKGDWKALYKLANEVKIIAAELELKDLVDRGYLINWSGEWKNQNVDNFEITDKFKHLVFIDTHDAGEELFKEYPKWIVIEGRSIPATQGGDYRGKYYGKDEILELYCNKISNDYVQHEMNMVGLRKAIASNIQFPVLRKFVFDELWHSFNEFQAEERKEIKVV